MTTRLTPAERDVLLHALEQRFARHPQRHPHTPWPEVLARLQSRPQALVALQAMEQTGGEPDVVVLDSAAGWVFCDCAAETPQGRRSLCYDDAALQARKEHKPPGSALGMAAALGIALLDEAQYRALQQCGAFDQKTSSWVLTPPGIREQGGALFCDRRYGAVFLYHNGAQSYYASRGFRGLLAV